MWEHGVPDERTLELFPGLKSVSERSFDILKLNGFKFPDTAGTIELSQDINRCKPKLHTLQTL
jgi:hypothetical protein